MLAELQARAIYHLRWNLERIEKCLALVDDSELWQRPNGNSLSLGNQLLHLNGNLTQWILHGLGGADDQRQRNSEFETGSGHTLSQLIARLRQTVEACTNVVAQLTEGELGYIRPIQAYRWSGLAILLHAVEHFSYHTGQVVFWVKQLRDRPMDFYAGLDLDSTN